MFPVVETYREASQFLRTRNTIRYEPVIVLSADFRRAHSPIRFSLAESVYGTLAAQLFIIPWRFLFVDDPNVWELPPGAAVNQIFIQIAVLMAPFAWAASNWILARVAAGAAPHHRTRHPRASDVWLFLEGAYGFWGRLALTLFLTIAGCVVGVSDDLNPSFVTKILRFEAGLAYGVAVAVPVLLLFIWLYYSVVDGTLQMVQAYRRLVHPQAKGGPLLAFYSYVWVALVVLRIFPVSLLLGGLLVAIPCLIAAFVGYEAGHFIRYAVGLESVGIVPIERFEEGLPY